MAVSDHRIALRIAHVDDAERIACLHTESWRRTYRGMMTDEFLDGGALENRRRVWHERLGMPAANQYVCIAQEAADMAARAFYECLGATDAGTIDLEDPGGGRAPNCRYVWARPDLLLPVTFPALPTPIPR